MSTTNEPGSAVQTMQNPELEAARISFSVTNKKNRTPEFAYIYMTDNRHNAEPWGHLEISILNPDLKPIVVTDASRLEVHVPSDLLSLQDLRLIQLEPQSETIWTLLVREDHVLQLNLKPGQTISIFKDSPAIVLLQGVLAPLGKALDRTLTFVWSGFEGIKDNSRGFHVLREFIPNENRNARIECKWGSRVEYRGSSEDVYVTPSAVKVGFPGIENRLILNLVNSEHAPLKTTSDTEFVVSFTTDEFGDQISALCTNEQLKTAKCRCMELLPEKAWRVDPQTQGRTTRWVLTPPRPGMVFENHVVSFEFTGIVTKMAIAPTSPVLIHWRGIDGYNPGYAVATVSKSEAYPYVRSLEATLHGRKLHPGEKVDFKDPVQLEWELFAADECTISGLPGSFGWRGTTPLSPELESNEYELKPRITLDAHVKTGNSKTAVVGVTETEIVKLNVTKAGLLPAQVELTWECKSGDCFLSGPGLDRVKVERSGSRMVDAGRPPFELECAGLKKLTQSCYVQIPHANCSLQVEWLPEARKGRWTWTTSYANKCEVTAFVGDHLHDISNELSGTHELSFDSFFFIAVLAHGNGSAAVICVIPPTDGILPALHFQELKLTSGPNHLAEWQFIGAQRSEVECQDANRDILWKTQDANGQKEFDYKNLSHRYFNTAWLGGPNPSSEIGLAIEPYARRSQSDDKAYLADFAQTMAHFQSLPDPQDAPVSLVKELLHKLLAG